jgi:hypothetical protein
MSMRTNHSRRLSGSFGSSIASLALPGDNKTRAMLDKWEADLKKALLKLYPLQGIEILSRVNGESGCSFILSNESHAVFERLAVDIPEELGGRWSVDKENAAVPGKKYASQVTYVTKAVIVMVSAANMPTPWHKLLWKWAKYLAQTLVLLYLVYIIW